MQSTATVCGLFSYFVRAPQCSLVVYTYIVCSNTGYVIDLHHVCKPINPGIEDVDVKLQISGNQVQVSEESKNFAAGLISENINNIYLVKQDC